TGAASDYNPTYCTVLSTGVWDATNGCCDTDDAWCADDGWYCYDGHRSPLSDLSGGACACLSPGSGWDTTRMCCDAWDSWPTACHAEEPGADLGAVDAYFASGAGHTALLDLDKESKTIIDKMREAYMVAYIFDAGADISEINAFRGLTEDEYHTLIRDTLRTRADARVKEILDMPLFQRPPDPTADIVALVNNGLTAEELDKLSRYSENRSYVAVVLGRIDAASVPITVSVVKQLGDDSLGDEVRRRLITHTWSVFSRRLDHDAKLFSSTCSLDSDLRALNVQDDIDLVAMEYAQVNDLLVLLEDDPDGSMCGNWFNRGGCGRWKAYTVASRPVDILAWTCNEPECTCLSPTFSVNDVLTMSNAFSPAQEYSFPEERGQSWTDRFTPSAGRIIVESDGCFFLRMSQKLPYGQFVPLDTEGDCTKVFTGDGCSSVKDYEAPDSEIVAEVMPFDEKEASLFDPPWWDERWSHRVPVTITNAVATDLTNVQVVVPLDTKAIIDAGKMGSDCGDIRVVDQEGALLSHWVGPDCGGTATKAWVKLATLPASGTVVFHIYYGNKDVGSISDGPSVFALFDDFEDGNIDGWAASQTLKDASGETYQVTATSDSAGAGTYSLFIDTHASCYATPCCGIYALASRDVGLPDGTYVVDLLRRAWGQRWGYCGKGGGAWVPRSFVRHGDADIFSTTATYTSNECGSGDINWGEVTTDPFDVTGGTATIRLVTYSWDCEDGRGWFDDVRVRKSVDPAPAVTSGDEESLEPESSDWIPSKAPFDENVVNSETSGGFGTALAFDGVDEYVAVPSHATINFAGDDDFTLEAWVYNEADGTASHIIGKRFVGRCDLSLYLEVKADNKLTFGIDSFSCSTCGGSSARCWSWTTSTTEVPANRWAHVAIAKSGYDVKMYINGKLDATGTLSSESYGAKTAATELRIGRSRGEHPNDVVDYFNGKIDEVRVWNTALNEGT
ncbi:MAG: DUF2341 domain-containing protein, partial [Candidatus Undinarchaeales archaeon]|nr:DUF2341 domain-containing protein [Candidatus Undinarchaeales archaeon]